jgi:hypothetical protein
MAAFHGQSHYEFEQEIDMHENVSDQKEQGQQSEKRRSRRQLLSKGIVAATAAIGAGALLEQGRASAHTDMPADNVGNFSSSNSSIPAVTATGTNGATGVSATSDTGNAIYASSNGNDSIHAVGNTSGRSALFAEGGAGYGVYATSQSTNGVFGYSATGIGMEAQSGSGDVFHAYTAGPGIAVTAQSGSGIGLYTTSSSGPALVANGHVQLQGNSVGQATLAAGKTSVTVTTSAATTSSNILLTPLGNPGGNLWVTRASGSFTIHASKAPTVNLSIAYLIIN